MAKVCEKHSIEYTKSGNSMRCLKCDRERKREHAEEVERYRQSEAGKTTKRKYRRSEKGKTSARQYRLRNYSKISARKAVEYALRKGILVVPEVCSRCGLSVKIEAHHHRGYEKEYKLEVIWLCHPCHVSIHS
jgi:hypothetical protein